MMTKIKLTNLPWHLNSRDVAKLVSSIARSQVQSARVLYAKETGISRGIALMGVHERAAIELIRKGDIEIDGRACQVRRMVEKDQ